MLSQHLISETKEQSSISLSSTEKMSDDLNNQQSDEEKTIEKESSTQEFFQVEFNSDEIQESESASLSVNVPFSEQMSYAWKMGGIVGTFFSTSAYCVGYIVERDLVKMQAAQYLAIPCVSSILAPSVVGAFAYLLPGQLDFKFMCKSFIVSGITTGVVDSLASIIFPNAPYAPASLVIPTLTAMTILNIPAPEVCLSIPSVCHKITKWTDNCFGLFRSKSNNSSQSNMNQSNENLPLISSMKI